MTASSWIAPEEAADILILRLSALGDIIHTIPAVQSLKRQRPCVRIHWLTEKPYVPFLQHVAGIDRVWEANTRKWRAGLSGFGEARRLVRSLRELSLKASLDFQGLVKSAALGKLARPEAAIGFHRSALREPAASWLYTRRVAPAAGRRHCVEACGELLSALGLHADGLERIDLRLPEMTAVSVEERLHGLGLSQPILLSPGAGWATKLWPARNFGLLARRIESELKRGVAFVYGPGEESLAREAQAAAGALAPPAIGCDLLELSALCQRARLMIASDTGPLHLAAALGAPCVALMGPTHAWRNGPYGSQHSVIQLAKPCPNPYKRRCHDHFCMDIPVDEAYAAVRGQLEG